MCYAYIIVTTGKDSNQDECGSSQLHSSSNGMISIDLDLIEMTRGHRADKDKEKKSYIPSQSPISMEHEGHTSR